MQTVKKSQWLPKFQRERGMNRWRTGDFKGNETILCDATMVDA